MHVPAAFYRGGTSRGLFFRAADLAPFQPSVRDQIICTAMGSPDPDRRQIDGLGGGVSSLSKTAVLSAPGVGLYNRVLAELGSAWGLPGKPFVDDQAMASDPKTGWDVVYRFGQVPIAQGTTVDWSSTCGNLLSAVALYAVQMRIMRQENIAQRAAELGAEHTFRLPIRIMMASPGTRALVYVPMIRRDTRHGAVWMLSEVDDTAIAGVPGKAPGITVEMALEASPLPTGNVRDTVDVDGRTIPVTVIDAGLPTVFVHAADLGASSAQMAGPAAALDTDRALHARIESVRQQAARLTPALAAGLCLSAPKVCLVHPRAPYTTSGGVAIAAEDMDVLVRAVSVGDAHRSIPATALSAFAVGAALADSVVAQAMAQGGAVCAPPAANLRSIKIGQPAGTSTAIAKLGAQGPEAIVCAAIGGSALGSYVQ
ncbi:hypothetical protein MVES_001301 [Malassezia vespertilionis]|uniref:PrpF protein n=1 Tax=Malassezia vespertilionis TaxID=2020962 RepID=A0A2N1JFH1_9BASI|nr:hypothetical protein MVES_001301 [Malassezia vespertilionis]